MTPNLSKRLLFASLSSKGTEQEQVIKQPWFLLLLLGSTVYLSFPYFPSFLLP
jgi:hypothetical protein